MRIPLPSRFLDQPINVLDFHFAYQAIPAQVKAGPDLRTLSAAFDVLAVVPRGAPLPPGAGNQLPAPGDQARPMRG